jgi:predicted DNA-binding protein (MmcQ/YjbR family)
MNIEAYRIYCLNKKGVTEEFPFDETTLVFKVMGKMFALTDLESEFSINLKCDPEKAIELREKYSAVKPGYHMSKKHWNTVTVDGSVTDDLIYDWIDDSYDLVIKKLPKKLLLSLPGDKE